MGYLIIYCISRRPSFSGGWSGTRWADKDLLFAAATLDDVASSEHVRDGGIRAVAGCLAFAGEAGVFGIAAEAMTPAVMVSNGFDVWGAGGADGIGLVWCWFGWLVECWLDTLDVGCLVVSGGAGGEGTFAFHIGSSEVRLEIC